MESRAGRRRRLAARLIDVFVVFFASMFLYFGAYILYFATADCASAGFTVVCGNESTGTYVTLAVLGLAFIFPLVYESVFRRTLGKAVLDLDVVDKDGLPASRGKRLKRSFLAWAPMLAFFAGVLAAPNETSDSIGALWSMYVVLLLVLVLARQPTPYEWLSGTRVSHRRPVLVPAQAPGAPTQEASAPN